MYRDIYKEHKETIERIFANANENHSMRYTRMHGLQKVKMQVTLTSSNITKTALHTQHEVLFRLQAVSPQSLIT